MAPNPPSTLPLPQRLLALGQTLQFAWFMGHLTLLLTTLRYVFAAMKFSTGTRIASFSYRLAFLSAAVTYGIVVYKAYRPKVRAGQVQGGQAGLFKILGDENVQYLFMAFMWLYSKPIFAALLPFAVYSTFHFLTYARTNLIPTCIPPVTNTAPGSSGAPKGTQPAISEAINKFVKENYDGSMHLVANLELFLWLRVCGGALIFRNSWILLVIYTAFLRIRYSQSGFARDALKSLERRGDSIVADPRIPESLRSTWGTAKGLVRSFGDATDLSKVLGGGAGAGARKAQ